MTVSHALPFPWNEPLVGTVVGQDFHTNFIAHAQELLGNVVGPHDFVKVELRLVVHELTLGPGDFLGRGAVGVETPVGHGTDDAVAGVQAPVLLELTAVEVDRYRSLEIRDRRDRRVVTVLELLSPSNKSRGEDRDAYLLKRRQILASQTHLVEIDLTRGGQRPEPPTLPPCRHYALVSRHEDPPTIGVCPFGLRDSLPTIPIPMRSPDPAVSLDLKQVLDRAYDAARYDRFIHDDDPVPPLSREDRDWAGAFLSNSR